MPESNLLVSVILPLPDHRGLYSQGIQSFLNQSMDKASMEVIACSDGSVPELEQETEQKYPEARLIRQAGSSLHELYNLGVSHASGKYLFFSEMHCIAHRDCVAQAIEYAEREGVDCVCSHSSGINQNRVAAGVETIFENDLESWKRNSIAKVSLRGFLIERKLWEAMGGFQSEFGQFSEVMLGRDLLQAGKQFGYADRSIVGHCNETNIKDLIPLLIKYGYDECHSNHVAPPAAAELLCEEWALYRERPHKRAALMRRFRWRLFYLSTVMKFSPPDHPRFLQAFQELWELSIRIGRLKYLRELDQLERRSALLAKSA